MSAFIGIDWGATRLRAWRFEADGRATDHRANDAGIASVRGGDFADVLRNLIDDWIDGQTPLVLAGMIGSRNGWREAPYLPCPADPDALGTARPLADRYATALREAGAGKLSIIDGESASMRGFSMIGRSILLEKK